MGHDVAINILVQFSMVLLLFCLECSWSSRIERNLVAKLILIVAWFQTLTPTLSRSVTFASKLNLEKQCLEPRAPTIDETKRLGDLRTPAPVRRLRLETDDQQPATALKCGWLRVRVVGAECRRYPEACLLSYPSGYLAGVNTLCSAWPIILSPLICPSRPGTPSTCPP